MISIVAVAALAMASGPGSNTASEELSSLPDYILFLQSSPIISSVIEIPDNSEVAELISEVTKETTFASRVPLQDRIT